MNSILLSFDLEEFDIPEEYGQAIPENEKIEISRKGADVLLQLLDKLEVKATFYTTAFFAEANKEFIKKISEKHEIASHGFYHSSFKPEDIALSKASLESIIGKPIRGFRMARLQPIDESLLAKSGYIYNSSVNPTYLPGRYNNLGKPRRPHLLGNLISLPVSVTPLVRIPLFWLSFKNFSYGFYRSMAIRTMRKDGYLNLYFHPWEFVDISKYKLPTYIKKVSGDKLLNKLEILIRDLKEYGTFITSSEYCDKEFKKN